jgi:quinol monooxygenase YgiN
MVLYVEKYDINPDKLEAYTKWQGSAVKCTLAVPGVVEFRAFRSATGSSQVMVTWEFPDMTTWAAWQSHEEIQKLQDELRSYTLNLKIELWGPSPNTPVPVRPGK